MRALALALGLCALGFVAVLTLDWRRAVACSPPLPDGPPAADASTNAGDFYVSYRAVEPTSTLYTLPRNVTFTVTYGVGVLKPGAEVGLGDLTLLSASGDPIPADVHRVLDPPVYVIVPRDLLPADETISIADRFGAIPCGLDAPCPYLDPTPFASVSIGGGVDVEKPVLADRTVVLRDWKAYGSVESCMDTLCAGLEISQIFEGAVDPDTPAAAIRYRIRYAGGGSFDYPYPIVATRMECTHCFHAFDSPPVTDLGPYVVSAVDLLGHESDGRIVVTIAPASCDSLIIGDGGVVSVVDAVPEPDAPPPAPAPPDAPIADVAPSSGGGCSTTGMASEPWLALGVVSLLLGRARDRSRRTRRGRGSASRS